MKRKDYRKMMQAKKRNRNYAKMTVLASLGLGVVLGNSTIIKAEARDWKPNTSTTIKQGDKQYTIKWGDYLELISKDSGLTIETLMKLNDSIVNANLIYAGNVIYFGDGVNAIVKDSQGNTIATAPLTESDKAGIKQADAQKVNRASKTDSKKKNDSKVSVNNKGNGTGTVTKPVTPTKPKPSEPKPPVTPDIQEVSMKVYYLQVVSADDLDEAIVLKEETIKAKKGEKVTVKAKEFDKMNLISDSSITVTAEENTEIIFDYVHEDAREITVRSITEDGKVLDEFIDTDFDILVGKEISYTAGEFEGYDLVGSKEKTITVNTDNDKNVIEFVYRKKADVPVEKVDVWVKYLAEDGSLIEDEHKSVEKGKIFKFEAKDLTSKGYILDDKATKEVVAEVGTVVTFQYKSSAPVEGMATLTTRYVDEAGNDIHEPKTQEVKIGYTYVTYPITIAGYEEIDYRGRTGEMVAGGVTEVIVYKKLDDAKPQHTTENVTVNVDEAGNVLSSTDGYEKVSESTDGGKVTTQPNGDTHTVYTTTVVWKKVVVTPPTGGVVNVDPSQFGGRVTSASEVEGALTSNGLTFATWDGANDYGVAMQEANPHNTDFDGFNVFSIKMKDGSTRYVMEWHINL